jgi:Flp pilus assembly protein TadD
LSVFTNMALAYALLANGRYAEAVAQSRKALDLNSSFEDIWWDMGMAYAYMGAKDEAMKAFARAGQLERGPSWRPAAIEIAITGDREAAARMMAEREMKPPGNRRALDVARTYGVIGDQQRTLEWLARAWQERDPQVVWLKIDPRFRSIRETPQYKKYLGQLGLAQ